MSLLEVTRGDDTTFDIALTDSDGAALNLAGATLRFTAKYRHEDADVDAVIAKDTDAGITVVSEAGGTATITLDSADTASLVGRTVLFWDVEVEGSDGSLRTPLDGRLVVLPDASHTVAGS